jgi:hypothetical protein
MTHGEVMAALLGFSAGLPTGCALFAWALVRRRRTEPLEEAIARVIVERRGNP